MLKRTFVLAAVAAGLFSTTAMADVTAASDDLRFNLKGEIASVCDINPDSDVNVTVDMTNFSAQGIAGVTYSCNSPYTLTIKSVNGGLVHQESQGDIVIDYMINTFGFLDAEQGSGPQTFQASLITSATELDKNDDWDSFVTNVGAQVGNIDLVFPGRQDAYVAGTYEDQIELVLTADL